MEKLDEKGFVFLDDASRPFFVRMYAGKAWMFYWHPDNKWVTFRPVTQAEIFRFCVKRLPDEQAELYHKQNL